MNRSLESLSLEDGLTGLGNRRKFDLPLANAHQSSAGHASLALLMIDVDYFKRYNDMYGHPSGDACLQQAAAAVKAARSRATDVIARYGGEEIAVLLLQTDLAGATATAERIQRCIEALNIAHAGSPLGRVTVSIAVAVADAGPANQHHSEGTLVSAADEALYTAKAYGRNRVSLAASLKRAHTPVISVKETR